MRKFRILFSIFVLLGVVALNTYAAAPTRQATYGSVTGITTHQATLSWVNGNGSGRVVVMHTGTTWDDAWDPSGSGWGGVGGAVNFNTAAPTADGAKVVYSGTGAGNQVTVTNLDANQSYIFKIYERSSGWEYNLTSVTYRNNPRTFNTLSAPTEPVDVAIGFRSTADINNASLEMTWSHTAFHTGYFVELAHDAAFTDFSGECAPYENLDVGDVQAYTFNNLVGATPYYFRIRTYLTSRTNLTPWVAYDEQNTVLTSIYTFDVAPNAPDSYTHPLALGSHDHTTMTFTWQDPTNQVPDEYLVYIRKGSPITEEPLGPDGSAVTGADANYSNAATGMPQLFTGDPTYLVFAGYGTSVNITGLDPGSNYYFAIYGYNTGGTDFDIDGNYVGPHGTPDIYAYSTIFATDVPLPTISADPLVAPTGLVVSAFGSDHLTLQWNAVAGIEEYMIIANTVATTATADDGVTYTNPAGVYTDGVALDDDFIVYLGDGGAGATRSIDITALTPNTHYYFTLVPVNKDAGDGSEAYGDDVAATVDRTTLADDPDGITDFEIINRDETELGYNFTPPVADSVLILYKAGSAITFVPIDGAAYHVGDVVGDATVGFVGSISDPPTPLTGLTANTVYFAAAYTFNGAEDGAQAYTDDPGFDSHTTLATDPADPTEIHVSARTTTSLELTWTSADPSGSIVLMKQGAGPFTFAPGDFPYDGQVYTFSTDFSSPVVQDPPLPVGENVVYTGTDHHVTITGLTAGAEYSFMVWSYYGQEYAPHPGEGSNNYSANAVSNSGYTLATQPEAPTAFSFDNRDETEMDISWSAPAGGDGPDGYIVYYGTAAVATSVPADGTEYTTGTAGNRSWVDVGASTSATITGLTANTVYYYEVYAYRSAGPGTNTSNYGPALTDNHTTLEVTPGDPGAITVTAKTQTTLTLSWTAIPHGIVLFGTADPNTDPSDGMTYAAGSSLFTGATDIGNAQIVYNGNGNTVTVTGLDEETQYFFRVYSYSGAVYAPKAPEGSEEINETYSAGNTYTLAPEPDAPTDLVFDGRTISTIDFSWTEPAGRADKYIVLYGTAGVPTGHPANGVTYNLSDAIGNRVVGYIGTDPTSTIAALTTNTPYYFEVYAFNENGSSSEDYSSALTGTHTTLAAEPLAATGGTITGRTVGSMTISWTSPANSLVLIDDAPITDVPTDGITYAGNTVYDEGFEIGSSHVVYSGGGNSVTVTGLDAGTRYYYAIFSYAGGDYAPHAGTGSENYNTGAPDNVDGYTLAERPSPITAFTYIDRDETTMTLGWGAPADGPLPVKYIVLYGPATVPTGVPADGNAYIAGNTIGNRTVAYVGDLPDPSGFQITGLTRNTVYHFETYAYNSVVGATNTESYSTAVSSSHTTLTNDPGAASGLAITGNSMTSLSVSWTSPGNSIVLIKEGAPITTPPSDGIVYTGNNSFGNIGASVIDGAQVVFSGAGTSLTINNLNPASHYYVAVYAFLGAEYAGQPGQGSQEYDETGSFIDGYTQSLQPDAPNAFIWGTRTTTTLTYAWNYNPATGNEANTFLVFEGTGDPSFTPANGTSYTVGNTYGGTSTLIYKGSDLNVYKSLGSLTEDTRYYFRVWGLNQVDGGGNGSEHYSATSLFDSHTTLKTEPVAQVTGFNSTANVDGTITLNWTNAPLTDGTIILVDDASIVDDPVDGTTYTASTVYDDGSEVGASAHVVYIGTGTSVTITGLTAGTTYYFKAYSFNGTDFAPHTGTGSENYYLADAPSTSNVALATQPNAPTMANFGTRAITSMVVNWNAPAGGADKYLVVALEGGVPGGVPTNGVTYTDGSSVYGGYQPFGTGYVVYNGSATSCTITGLHQEYIMNIKVFAYNTAGAGSENYNTTPAQGRHITIEDPTTATVSSFTTSNIGAASIQLNWGVTGEADNVLILGAQGASVSGDPINGVDYASFASTTWTSAGTPAGQSWKVLYAGVPGGSPITVSGLDGNTQYTFKAIPYNGDAYAGSPAVANDGDNNYYTAGAASTTATTAENSIPTALGIIMPNPIISATAFNFKVVVLNQYGAPVNTPTPITGTITASGPGTLAGTPVAFTISAATCSTTVSLTYTYANGTNPVTFSVSSTCGLPGTCTPTNNVKVLPQAPATQDNNLAFNTTRKTTFGVTWSHGVVGGKSFVVAKEGFNYPAPNLPVSGNVYGSFNNAFSSAPALAGDATERVVYYGTANSFTLSGLNDAGNTYYWVRVYGYTGDPATGIENFNTGVSSANSKRNLTASRREALPGEANNYDNNAPGFEVGPIMPQPAKDRITFELNVIENSAPFSIEVYDMDGRRLLAPYDGRLMAIGATNVEIPLGNLAAGTYLLKVASGADMMLYYFVLVP